jgi:acetyl-CoA acetyltransferase family protein
MASTVAYDLVMQRQAAIICALRTPIGRYGGAISSVRPDDLAALVIRAVVARSGLDGALIDDVYLGAANQAGEDNRNVARMAALLAGLPVSVPGSTVNRLCASGLEAINIAARMIEADHGDVFIAGGVESMSRAPLVVSKAQTPFDREQELVDTSIGWRFVNPRLAAAHHPYSMGQTAENVAQRHNVSREDQDRFALASQKKWALANQGGLFADELVPVEVSQRKSDRLLVSVDEHPRPDTTLEQLSRLRPAFTNGAPGTVTAGNSSGVNDGAAALLLVEVRRAASLGLTPIAFVGASASAGVDPAHMGIGPVPAIASRPCSRAGLTLGEIGLHRDSTRRSPPRRSRACASSGSTPSRLSTSTAEPSPSGTRSGAAARASLCHAGARDVSGRSSNLGLATLCVGVGQGLATVFDLA